MQMTLRGMVYSQFPNVSAFAKRMMWDRKKASRIIAGKQAPSADDMYQIAKVLGITDSATFMALFFPQLVHNVDRKD